MGNGLFYLQRGNDMMLQQIVRKWAIGAAVVLSMVLFSTGSASAHLFGHGHGCCGSCGYDYCCGSSGGCWGSSGGCCGGSWGGWHHGSCGCCGYVVYSCYCSGGCYGSSGGCWGSSGGCWGSSGGCYGGTVIESAPAYSTPGVPAMPKAPVTTPPTPPTPGAGTYIQPDAGYLFVSVPTDAKVFVNGRVTSSTGADRQYVSRGLDRDQRYAYEVRAEFVRDGKPVTETKTVQLTGGSMATVAFGSETKPATTASIAPKTVLKLNVPADAKVFLAGKETNSTGAIREFSTTALSTGGEWNDYTIRVVSNGESKDATISLKAGDSREMTFDFPAKVAASR